MRKKLFSILALLLMAVTAQATDYPTGLTDGQVLHVGDTFTPETSYHLPGWSWTMGSGNAPYKLVRVNFTPGATPFEEATIEEAADGQYYAFYVSGWNSYNIPTNPEGGISGLGEQVFEATATSDGLTVTKNDTEVSFAIHEASAPAGKALKPDATRKVWTLDAMPAGNVELQVAYFPGMLTLPAKTAQGSIEVVGLGASTLPAGFDTDGTNYYVEPKTQFQVKAVPAEGYHLVSLSDGTNTYDVDADGIATVTMPEGDADLTVTATFSDEFELTFDDVNFKTNQNITVKVGDADKTLDQDGKLSVKAGQTVTLTAKQGYKFRSVEAKKAGAALLSLQVCGQTIYYAEGETWGDAIKNHPTENAGWKLDGDGYVNHDSFGYLLVSNDFVPGNTPIDPNASYDCTGI